MVGAVDVNVARVTITACTAVVRLQPTQPDDAGGNQVALLFVLGEFGKNLPCGQTAL